MPAGEATMTGDSIEDPIGVRISEFRHAFEGEGDDRAIAERFLFHGQCHAIDEATHFDIKQRIAQEFGINTSTDLFIVGSAKLGFSIAPPKRWKRFDDTSDIDVAIINHELYQAVWHEVHDYQLSGAYWPDRRQFEKNFLRGWIRPDLLPSSPMLPFTARWWEFFRSLKSEQLAGPYKIAGALYHDIQFLVKYQASAVARCRESEV
jgi:hypothetical protein